jgi:hypothetical protein
MRVPMRVPLSASFYLRLHPAFFWANRPTYGFLPWLHMHRLGMKARKHKPPELANITENELMEHKTVEFPSPRRRRRLRRCAFFLVFIILALCLGSFELEVPTCARPPLSSSAVEDQVLCVWKVSFNCKLHFGAPYNTDSHLSRWASVCVCVCECIFVYLYMCISIGVLVCMINLFDSIRIWFCLPGFIA